MFLEVVTDSLFCLAEPDSDISDMAVNVLGSTTPFKPV